MDKNAAEAVGLDLSAIERMSPSELLAFYQAYIKDRNAAIYDRHRAGAPPASVVEDLTRLADAVIGGLSTAVVRQVQERGLVWQPDEFSLVALGGYGRGELFPHSDIDLMMLYEEGANKAVLAYARRMLQMLWDLGYHVGHGTRTIRDCLEIARVDLTTRTAFMEARLIYGSPELFRKFYAQFWSKVGRKRPRQFVAAKLQERAEEYARYGSTVYLLQPDIKKSKGGLRDLNLLKWVSAVTHGATRLEVLAGEGHMTQQECHLMRAAQDFLWQLRTELHFHAGRCQDVLSFQEQLRLAEVFRFEEEASLLGVERFMREYYRHSSGVHEITTRFIHRSRPRALRERLIKRFSRSLVNEFFLLTRYEIGVDPSRRDALFQSPANILQLFRLSQIYRVPVAQETQAMIHDQGDGLPRGHWDSPAAGRLFLQILASPGQIAETLKMMHGFNLLERLVPDYEHVHYLMQFNEYHKYTIDEHCIRAVGQAESLAGQKGKVARVYRGMKRKDLLHLALLLHDIGKGREGDHCLIGEQIALRAADRLGLSGEDRELLAFLVREHLVMAHTAFRRDLSDDAVLLHFAKKVGNPDALRMLYVLTYADISAVGPDAWTPWKRDLIHDLYVKTMEVLAGTAEGLTQEERGERVRSEIRERYGRDLAPDWLREQLDAMTLRYLLATPADTIARHLRRLQSLGSEKVLVDADYSPEYKTAEYIVYTHDDLIPGIFSKIAGVMAAKGLQILGAEIHTRRDGVVIDTFQVTDPDYSGRPPAHRFEDVAGSVKSVLMGEIAVEALIARSARFPFDRWRPPRFEPTRIEINNDISGRYTVIDVFAHDRQGLLYVMTKAIFDLALSIHFAKVATRLDQVVDVFYVTDLEGKKVEEPERLQAVRQSLSAKIDEFLQRSHGEERSISA